MARTPWDNPKAEDTFSKHEVKKEGFRIKDVHDVRENVSGIDTFEERWKGTPHSFEGDNTVDYEEAISGSYPKKRIR